MTRPFLLHLLVFVYRDLSFLFLVLVLLLCARGLLRSTQAGQPYRQRSGGRSRRGRKREVHDDMTPTAVQHRRAGGEPWQDSVATEVCAQRNHCQRFV